MSEAKRCLVTVTTSTFHPEGPQSTLQSSISNWLKLMIGNGAKGSENLLSSWNSMDAEWGYPGHGVGNSPKLQRSLGKW